jgi:phosphopantothenate---cysteine ligase (CTP)
MKLLVTAGGTLVPIDRVRFISNSFTGRTGARVALEAFRRGHQVSLLTSNPESVADVLGKKPPVDPRWLSIPYRTFDELQKALRDAITAGGYDGIVHSAAVSDYRPGGIFALGRGSTFDEHDGRWHGDPFPALVDRAAGKVKSDEPELWLRLVKAPKIVDQIRREWNFRGVLVKFKLEVDVSNDQLTEIAERSRLQSDADLMVANTLDGAAHYAFIGPRFGRYERVARAELSTKLIEAIERRLKERKSG